MLPTGIGYSKGVSSLLASIALMVGWCFLIHDPYAQAEDAYSTDAFLHWDNNLDQKTSQGISEQLDAERVSIGKAASGNGTIAPLQDYSEVP